MPAPAPAVPPRHRRTRPPHPLIVLAAAALSVPLLHLPIARATNITWTGGGATDQWNDPGNWTAGPVASDDAFIGTGFSSGTSIYVYTGTSINSLTINTTTPFSLNGNIYLTSGNLTRQNVSGVESDQFLGAPVLGANGTFNIAGSGALLLDHVAQPSGTTRSLTKTGAGTLAFTGDVPSANAYSGPTTISQGYLRLSNTHTLGLNATTVAASATLELESLDAYDYVSLPASTTLRIGGDGVPLGLLGHDGAIKNRAGSSVVSGAITLADDSSINVAAGSLSLLGTITDGASTFGLTKFGPGDLYLSAPNSYKGPTFITDGTLVAANPASLGSAGAISVTSAGSLALGNNISFPRPVYLATAGHNGQGALLATSGTNETAAGQITLSADASVGADSDATLTVSGLITDVAATHALTKVGAGTVVLTANNTYTGGTTVAQGTLRINGPNVLPGGATVNPGATLELPAGPITLNRPVNLNGPGASPTAGALHSLGSNTFAGAITLQSDAAVGADANNTLTLAGPVTGPFTLSKVGFGHLALTSTANSFSSLTVANGTLDLSNPAVLPAAAPLSVTGTNAAVDLSGNFTVNHPLSLSGTGLASAGALHNVAGDNTWSGPVSLTANSSVGVNTSTSLTLSGPVAGPGSLSKAGPGLLVLAGNNSYTGPTDIAAGTLRLASSGALGNTTQLTVPTDLTVELTNSISIPRPLLLGGTGPLNAPAIHNLAGANTLSGPITLANDTSISVDPASSLTLSGILTDTVNSFSLTKTGAGTLVLTGGPNAYDGPTLVTAGTLAITSNGAIGNPASTVTTSNGAKLSFAASLTTSRTFNLGTGSLQAAPGVTVTYAGATINGGFLRGPGTHSLAAGASLNAVTALPGTNLTQSAPATLTNFTNAGNLVSSAPLTFDGGFNTPAGSIASSSSLITSAFENDGTILLNPGATLTNSDNPLVSGGGSRISLAAGATLALGPTTLDLNGAFLNNNGSITGSAINANFGSLITGTGTFPPVIVNAGGTFQPGNTPAPLTPYTSAPVGIITQTPGTFSSSAPLTLAVDTTATIPNPTDSLTLTTPMNSSTVHLTKTGPGSLTLPVLRALSLTANDGRLAIAPAHTPASTSRLANLTLTGNGTLDLYDNDLILDRPTPADTDTAATLVRSYLAQGLLTSTTAATNPAHSTTLAYAPNTLLNLATFDTQPIDPTTLIIKYTLQGDANLDGRLDADDYALLDKGFTTHGAFWWQGDFNYDGQVDVSDYLLIDTTLGQAQGFSPGFLAQRESQFGAQYVQELLTSVPEPTSPMACLFTGLLFPRRRNRRKTHAFYG